MKIAVVNSDSDSLVLDHLAPIAYILNVPFLIKTEDSFNLCQKYYPQVNSKLVEELPIDYLANYDVLFEANFWHPDFFNIFQSFFNKKIKLIFTPHGHSDKGYINTIAIKSYMTQSGVLIYGDNLLEMLKYHKVLDKTKYALIGNLRLEYYLKNKKFYDDLIDLKIFSKLKKKNKTILYAPTWKDKENSTSFFEIFPKIIKNIPDNYNLIIKPHPLLEKKHPELFYSTIKNFQHPNLLFLENCPIIYPLLNVCDFYLGDFSSVGYDFLYFQKPMFFIDIQQRSLKNNSLKLHKCGISIPKKSWNNIFKFIENNTTNNYQNIQKKTYNTTFAKNLSIENIKKNILKLISN